MELIWVNTFACYKHFIPTGLVLLPTSFFNSVRSEMCIVVKYTCLTLIPKTGNQVGLYLVFLIFSIYTEQAWGCICFLPDLAGHSTKKNGCMQRFLRDTAVLF